METQVVKISLKTSCLFSKVRCLLLFGLFVLFCPFVKAGDDVIVPTEQNPHEKASIYIAQGTTIYVEENTPIVIAGQIQNTSVQKPATQKESIAKLPKTKKNRTSQKEIKSVSQSNRQESRTKIRNFPVPQEYFFTSAGVGKACGIPLPSHFQAYVERHYNILIINLLLLLMVVFYYTINFFCNHNGGFGFQRPPPSLIH